jgi:hypothetical protein
MKRRPGSLGMRLAGRTVGVAGVLAGGPGCFSDTGVGPLELEPPRNRIFKEPATFERDERWLEDPVAHVLAGGEVFFEDRSCWIPDLDSFDSFQDPTLGIPVGTTPVPSDCAADGKATGPVQFSASHKPEDLLPSKWCKTDKWRCP